MSDTDERKRVIVALDVPDVGAAQRVVDELGDAVRFYKIGLHLQLARSIDGFIDGLIDAGKDVFLDYKFADIGESMKGGVTGAAARGIRFVTIQGNGEVTRQGVAAALEGRREGLPKVFLVTVLTSVSEEDVHVIHRSKSTLEDLVLRRARQAQEWGCDGVIASGYEVRAIRKQFGDDFLVVVPGIRPRALQVEQDDQKRSVTPAEAIDAGADYIVVGRPILRQSDKAAAARRIVDEVSQALRRRAT